MPHCGSTGFLSGFYVGLACSQKWLARLESIAGEGFSAGSDVGRKSNTQNPTNHLLAQGFSAGWRSTVLTDGAGFTRHPTSALDYPCMGVNHSMSSHHV
jgi:hypothetical protein